MGEGGLRLPLRDRLLRLPLCVGARGGGGEGEWLRECGEGVRLRLREGEEA